MLRRRGKRSTSDAFDWLLYCMVITRLLQCGSGVLWSAFLWNICLSVCTQISETTHPNLAKFSAHVAYGSVHFWWRCNKLHTCGFVDDVMFSCNGPYGVVMQWGLKLKVTHEMEARIWHRGVYLNWLTRAGSGDRGEESDVYNCLVCR